MLLAEALLPLSLLLAPAELVSGVAMAPGCAIDAGLTSAAMDKAALEAKAVIAQIDADASRTPAEKAELKRKVSRIKIQMCLCAKSFDEVVGYYSKTMGASFVSAEREIVDDLRELARSGAFVLDDATLATWKGKTARASRWNRFEGTFELDIEDHLIDPRNGKVSKVTVLMATALE